MPPRTVNALTVDVEDYFHVAALSRSIARQSWDHQASRVERNTNRLLEVFDKCGYRATFFILGWVAERYPQLVREIATCGHEVASHGYSHQLIYSQTPSEFREETIRSKELLENITQTPVVGYRAASYSITSDSLWALDILAELGFEYDSSIFPVRHDRYGIPGTPAKPYRLLGPTGGALVEFPLSTLNVFGYRLPIAGGGYFRLFPYNLTRYAFCRINRERHPFVFYIHPWEIDPGQPRVKADMLSTFRHYNNLEKCYTRLEQLLEDFDFKPMSDVLGSVDLSEIWNYGTPQ